MWKSGFSPRASWRLVDLIAKTESPLYYIIPSSTRRMTGIRFKDMSAIQVAGWKILSFRAEFESRRGLWTNAGFDSTSSQPKKVGRRGSISGERIRGRTMMEVPVGLGRGLLERGGVTAESPSHCRQGQGQGQGWQVRWYGTKPPVTQAHLQTGTVGVTVGGRGLFGIEELRQPRDFFKLALEAVQRSEEIRTRLHREKEKEGNSNGPPPSCNGSVSPTSILSSSSSSSSSISSEQWAGRSNLEKIKDLDHMSNTLCSVIDAAELARNVHEDEAWREAAEETYAYLSGYIHELNTDVTLYGVLRELVESGMPGFNEEQRRTAVLLKNEFESSGIHLPDNDRQEVRDYLNEITRLESLFNQNITMKNKRFRVPSDLVQGIPGLEKDENGDVILSTDTDVLNAILRHAKHSELRKVMFIESNSSPVENLEVLRELILYRDKLARKLGFKSYAYRHMADKMEGDPERVERFLFDLADRIKGKAEEELNLLRETKFRYEGSSQLEAWDMIYYQGLIKSTKHKLDNNLLSAYFSLENCMNGLAILCDKLFGIELRKLPMDQDESWAGDKVKKIGLFHKTEGMLGIIYLDLFPRKAKYTHHAQFTIHCGCALREDPTKYQLPVVALVCNLSSTSKAPVEQNDVSDSSILLSHFALETLFHEFGHALHSLLSRTQFQHLSGTRVPSDFVETPSHIFEYFAWDHRVLKHFALHNVTKRPISEDMLTRLRLAKHEFSGLELQNQILYALVDQRLFGVQPIEPDPTSSKFLESVQKEVTSMPFASNTFWHARFGHLTGYGAGYYGYIYDRVFASHIWDNCFAKEPLGRSAGENLWKKFLIHGGAKDPHAILEDILGEKPRMDSFLTELTSSGKILPPSSNRL